MKKKSIIAILVGTVVIFASLMIVSSIEKTQASVVAPLNCDIIIDADGFTTPGDGIPEAVDVFDGAPLANFAATIPFASGTGVDMFDNDNSRNWTEGDDLMTEGMAFTGVPWSRNKRYDASVDKVILDKNGSLVDKQPVSFDLDGMGAMLRIRYYDADQDGTWDNGEDIVFDANNNYIYDEVCPPPPVIKVPVDIKPESCPNPLNVNTKGVLPVAILGFVPPPPPPPPPRLLVPPIPTASGFDLTKIDLTTVQLEGVSPSRSDFEDVAKPFKPFIGKSEATDCTTEGPDGLMDLTLKFDNQAIVAALGLVTDREVRVLKLTGNLLDGTPIVGEDVVVILKKK